MYIEPVPTLKWAQRHIHAVFFSSTVVWTGRDSFKLRFFSVLPKHVLFCVNGLTVIRLFPNRFLEFSSWHVVMSTWNFACFSVKIQRQVLAFNLLMCGCVSVGGGDSNCMSIFTEIIKYVDFFFFKMVLFLFALRYKFHHKSCCTAPHSHPGSLGGWLYRDPPGFPYTFRNSLELWLTAPLRDATIGIVFVYF